jgi:hypothetical protein
MPRLAHAFTNFTAGELSPRLDGRIDLAKYTNGVTNLENFIVHPHGGVTRRPGTEFIAEIKTSALSTRIFSFEFSTEQTYIIEAGNEYFRFYRNGGQILSGGSAVEISTPYATADLFELKFAQSADVMYIVHPSHKPRKLTRTSHTAWTLTEVPFSFGPFLDENTSATTITSNARTGTVTLTASADLFVSSDVGRLVKIYDGFAKISAFTNATTVSAVVQDNLNGRAELLPEYTATTISFTEGDPSSTGNEHNDRIVDSAKAFKDQGFVVGQLITVSGASSDNNGDHLIAEVTDDTILTSPSDDLAAQSAGSSFTIVGKLEATDEWSLGAFSDTTGYPGAICFFEERLVYGGTTSQPQTVFFSESGGFDQFNGGAQDADAMIYTLASSQVNVIRALAPSRTLIILTTGAEFAASSGTTADPITPTNIQIKRQTTYGTADVQPVTSGSAVLFLQRAKRKIRELQFNFDVDGYIAPDMTILAEHVSEGGFVELAVQQEPDNVIWVVRSDGQLCGLTYRREEQVVAWHRHIIGGISGAATITVTDFSNIATGTKLVLTKSDGSTVTITCQGAGAGTPDSNKFFHNESNNTTADNLFTLLNGLDDFTVANPAANVVTVKETTRAGTGFLSIESDDTTRLATTNQANALVESVAVIPGDLDEDEVYVVVQRTVNGATKRFIERLTDIDFGTAATNAFYVDSGLTYSGSAATTISGLTHLEGESVTILADGAAHPNKTVSSGAITLDRSATKAQIGLGYTSQLKTMRIEGGSAQGTSQGAFKRIHDVTVRLFRTVGAKVGSSSTNNDLIPFRSSADEMGQALDLFTGDKAIEFPNGYDTDAYVFVKQEQPLPMTVIGIYARMEVFDR